MLDTLSFLDDSFNVYLHVGGIVIGVVSDCVSSRAMSCMMMLLLAVPSVSVNLYILLVLVSVVSVVSMLVVSMSV